MNFIDLFAGAGGLSEGFIRAGFTPVAHVEMDTAACYTLRTRVAYYYLKEHNQKDIYISYLKGEISREKLYSYVPIEILNTVINSKIGEEENSEIFEKVDSLLNGKDVDLIVGGPPCQAYSLIGRAALKHRTEDERTRLYIYYGRFLKKYKPKAFVFENVPGLLTAGKGIYFRNIKKYYRSLGYNIEPKLFNSFEHGVVQHRKRIIIIGWKKDFEFQYPEIEINDKTYSREDIFSDLPAIKPGENKRVHSYKIPANKYLSETEIRNGIDFVTQHVTRPHNESDLKIYRLAIKELNKGNKIKNNEIPENLRTQKNITDFLDRFKVVGLEPHTMIAHIAKDGHHFIHPDIHQLRSISVREAARIQSFPDDYYFEGVKEAQNRSAAFRQIGNAVPPLLAEKIAKKIKELFNARK